MIDVIREGDELIALFEDMLAALIDASRANDWVEAAKMNATFGWFADAFGIEGGWHPILPGSEVGYFPLITYRPVENALLVVGCG